MMNEVHFFLLMDSQKADAELMAECSLCGAITTQPLELARFEGWIACSNCQIVMPLYVEVLDTLRGQAVEAQTTIDRLTSSANP